MANTEDSQQNPYKVLVIGDYAVGKTSIIKRYTEGVFSNKYKLTIGVDFAVKSVKWENDQTVNVAYWDVSGHERFGTMTRVYYKYAIAAIIVFDLSRPVTFEAVKKWQQDVNSKVELANGEPIPIMLLANKCDIENVKIDKEALDQFVKANNFVGWFPTSAQTNENVDKAMMFLIDKILQVADQQTQPNAAQDVVPLSGSTAHPDVAFEAARAEHQTGRICECG
mmetsp:Transcript_22312/g.33224  ORF Transcript_22312/g.33224 Transcript_22312/m.33224 type:complete len:224 (+) Transcript_22312:30-701(+)